MTVTMLHYDILLSLIPYLPPITMIEYATTCHQLCQPALRQLWNSPKITTPKSFQSFMQSLLNSILILPNPNNLPRFNYHRWIKQLTISFPTFQHISIHLLPLLLFNKLSNLTHVSLYNTYAIFSSNIQSLHLNRCIIKNMPIHIDANSDHLHHQQEEELNILTNIQSILNQNISIIESSSSSFILSAIYKSYLEDSSSSSIRLPLTHLSILNCTINIEPNHSINDNIETATIQLSDDHLSIIAHSCPKLIQCQMNGFFSDAEVNESDEQTADSSSITTAKSKMEERMEKLKQLKRRRATEIEQANRKDCNFEFQKSKENPRLEAKLERKKEEALKLQEKQKAEDAGEDYERKQFWKYSAESVANWEKKMAKKKSMANNGFTDHTQAAHKKYVKLISELKPDMQAYNEKKLESMEKAIRNGEEMSSSALINDIEYASIDNKPSKEAIDRLSGDIKKQIEKRETRSRERKDVKYDDISWINEKNRVFNQKIARFYDKYTKEIRENLERGTAL
ncbi:unnamed protein product [Cunninghamella blakesleeana]